MFLFCQDKDLLALEPTIFNSSNLKIHEIVSGTANLSDGKIIADSSLFEESIITPGMIAIVYKSIPSEGHAFEIISCDSATTIQVSVLRSHETQQQIKPASQSDIKFKIVSFNSVHAKISEQIAARILPSTITSTAQLSDSNKAKLKHAATIGSLAAIYLSRSTQLSNQDPDWTKHDYYKQQFEQTLNRTKLHFATDEAGCSDSTRTLGNISLRRI